MILDLSEEARADLTRLRAFGGRRWGRAQAKACLAALRALAAGNVAAGTMADEVGSRLRRRRFRSHVNFFRIDGDRLRVVRILGQRQDPGRHLSRSSP